MINKQSFFIGIALSLSFYFATAQIKSRERPVEWENLIYGGRFMDRFLPMPNLGGMTANTWGAKCVIPRDINNGIEDTEWSYWGGNARLLTDGRYHLFVCRWAENSPKGHMTWPNSIVVHAVSKNSFGPYKVIDEVGKGHNPEWFITNEGKYVISVINGYYVSDNVAGPWKYKRFSFDKRDRKIIDGLSNLTFAKREDGSFVMICRGGGVWISKDGLSTWNQLTDSTIYPPVDGRFEDPLIWKTNIQYHLIVNDWLGRIAWHLRSKDGITWKTEPGEAYQPGIAVYEDGTKENWFKYERIKVLQDEYGRATQAHFAVIDTLKHFDLQNDNHSSKQITIPLTIGKLITILNKENITNQTDEIVLSIKAENGFDPNTDVDINSLRFGAPEKVNFGGGLKVKNIKSDGKNAIITFEGKNHGITDKNFTAKLIGKDKQGKLIFAYAQLPGISYIEPALSARKPILNTSGTMLDIDVENFGQVSSHKSTIHVYSLIGENKIEIGNAIIQPIKPYERKTISIKTNVNQHETDDQLYLVLINKGKKDMVSFLTR